MKRMVLLLLFAIAFSGSNTSVIKGPQAKANLIAGNIIPGDTLLHRSYLYKQPIPNTIQSQDLIYRGYSNTRISAVYATEVGYTQFASAWIIAGGIWQNNVTIRAQTARGYGYYYMIEIWGRYY